ncbi:hypothetical protein D3C81_596470 [compost metagenome]
MLATLYSTRLRSLNAAWVAGSSSALFSPRKVGSALLGAITTNGLALPSSLANGASLSAANSGQATASKVARVSDRTSMQISLFSRLTKDYGSGRKIRRVSVNHPKEEGFGER